MAADDLARRIDAVEDELLPLKNLPAQVAACKAISEAARDNAAGTRRDVQALREETAEFRREVREAHRGAAAVLATTATAVTAPVTWRDRMKNSFALVLPIILALIAAYATIQAANVGGP